MTQIIVPSVSAGKDSTVTLMLALQQVPRDLIRPAFADTDNEHDEVYRYLDYLEGALGIKIKRLRADFTQALAHRRQYVAEKYPEKLVRGEPGGWHLKKAFRDDDDVDDDEALAEALPDAPAPPADIYAAAETEHYKWRKAVAPLTPAKASEVIARILSVLNPTGSAYLDLCLIKGRFPSRKAQFCTQFLKTEPLVEYQMALIEEFGAVQSWQGVRADESSWRAKLPAEEDVGGGLSVYRPILSWTVEQVFAFMKKHGIDPNPLYRLGFTRVGCMPCIHARKDELLEISRRFPGHIDRIEYWELMVSLASRREEASFFPDPDRDAHLDRRGVRKMVQWAQTGRGGVQFDFIRQEPASLGC